MNDDQLQFDRTCHVIYSKPCKAEIREKIAHHYPESQREAVWERVQMQYVDFLSDWRTDLGGEKNFHNGPGGNYDCIALMAYYAVCKDVTSLQEIEEMEGKLFLPSFRKLSKLKFIDINKPLCKKLLHRAFLNAKSSATSGATLRCTSRRLTRISPSTMSSPPVRPRNSPKSTTFSRSCPRSVIRICRHGAYSRASHPQNDLFERLQMRLKSG